MLKKKEGLQPRLDCVFEVMKTQIEINCPSCYILSFSMYVIESYDKRNYQLRNMKVG